MATMEAYAEFHLGEGEWREKRVLFLVSHGGDEFVIYEWTGEGEDDVETIEGAWDIEDGVEGIAAEMKKRGLSPKQKPVLSRIDLPGDEPGFGWRVSLEANFCDQCDQ